MPEVNTTTTTTSYTTTTHVPAIQTTPPSPGDTTTGAAATTPGPGTRPRSDSQRSGRSHGSNETNVIDYAPIPRERQRPSIRIRRGSSQLSVPAPGQQSQNAGQNPGQNLGPGGNGLQVVEGQRVGRSRSNSAPQPLHSDVQGNVIGNNGRTMRGSTSMAHMPGVAEESMSPTSSDIHQTSTISAANFHNDNPHILHDPTTARPGSSGVASGGGNSGVNGGRRRLRRARTNIADYNDEDDYEDGLVDILDVIDPEVATLSTLTNLQNSLFVPDLGKLLNRRPTYNLTRRPEDVEEAPSDSSSNAGDPSTEERKRRPTLAEQRTYTGGTLNTISSNVNDRYYAVLPHGVSLPGWSEEEKLELNDHVRHMLHSRRSKFKRSMKGFGQYASKPLGFFVTLYATLITLFGLAWVLFLIGWINVGGRKDYIVNVIDNVLVALFAIMGDGLAPFRCVDTYHMCFIAHYHHLTWRLRREQGLKKLPDHNDLPAIPPSELEADDEIDRQEFSVLNENQQKKLAHHQKKFSKSHSFYKPHETYTHHAFPLRLLVAIVVLLDCHSLLQIALGTCTWAINYHVRPFALTTVILCCSITVNITAGVLITVGDRRTRKKDVIEKIFRQELTAEAMKKVQKAREKEMERLGSGGLLQEEVSRPLESLNSTETSAYATPAGGITPLGERGPTPPPKVEE